MVIKYDLKKTYDKIEWNFFDKALAVWGFNENFKKLIVGCVRLVSFSFSSMGAWLGTFP